VCLLQVRQAFLLRPRSRELPCPLASATAGATRGPGAGVSKTGDTAYLVFVALIPQPGPLVVLIGVPICIISFVLFLLLCSLPTFCLFFYYFDYTRKENREEATSPPSRTPASCQNFVPTRIPDDADFADLAYLYSFSHVHIFFDSSRQ